MSVKLFYAIRSDRGLVRRNNEDSAYAGPHLIALSDGMGGHAAGEVASALMIEQIKKLDADHGDNDMLALLGSVADDGNRAIAAGVRNDPSTDGMGTTLTALLLGGDELAMIHVGDSRGYRLRDGKLEQITVDDTLVQKMVEEGSLTPAEVSDHPQRSMLLKAYTGRPVEPLLTNLGPRVGDRYMICSDGLSDPVSFDTIETAMNQAPSPQAAADRLVELAMQAGGPDNITVVVADIVDDETAGDDPLPVTPLLVGAINPDDPEVPRPDTAAGRAAELAARTPREIPPAPDGPHPDLPVIAAPPPLAAGPGSGKNNPRSRRGPLVVLVLAVVLLVVAAAGWAISDRLSNDYFVTTNNEAIVIDQGVDQVVFGRSLHHRYQATCLDTTGRVSLIDPAAADGDAAALPDGCSLFTLSDLAAADRGAVATLTGGSYDTVVTQIQRLADRALPVCVTRTPATTTTEPSAATTAAEESATGEPTATGEEPAAEETTTTGEEPATEETTAADATATDAPSEGEPTDAASATTTGEPSASPSETAAATATSTNRSGSRTQPGIDCREVN
ncbi:serine/threonine-protein phosphatase [Corynebacterium sp. CCM 8862]|uniref:Serine/threonine-protein phosphatase n=1 Tax=Corynebacterium mendelii TaxID=2765362 RepID=A0A939E2K9_9CORY|nr:protein phosphatase 2C domain-containing protein [Corynebacterium mendelii]MBN9644337.1 serine/threonine-protein phosphatase [Corynebacterium mendelii]